LGSSLAFCPSQADSWFTALLALSNILGAFAYLVFKKYLDFY
jgi:hypothetical protein